MNDLHDFFKTWEPILGLLIAILGGGWLKTCFDYRREKRRRKEEQIERENEKQQAKIEQEQKRNQEILKNFLIPFKRILGQTRRISQELLGDLQHLEYFPKELERYFDSLPNNDPRKFVWKQRVERLQTENVHAIELIKSNYAEIATEEFKKACDDYQYHVGEWDDVWKTKEGLEPTSGFDKPHRANPFPPEIEKALEAEIAIVQKRAVG